MNEQKGKCVALCALQMPAFHERHGRQDAAMRMDRDKEGTGRATTIPALSLPATLSPKTVEIKE